MLGLDVVLIQPDADIGRVDLHQFAQRVLQAAADGDGAAERGVALGQLLAARAAGGVDAGAGLVDDHVGDALLLQVLLDQLGEEILGMAAGGAVADHRHGELMFADQFEHFLPGFLAAVGFSHQIDYAVAQQVAELVERGQFAAALEAGIDRQEAMVVDRRLQEQIAEVLGKNAHGVDLGPIGQLAADVPLQAGQDQACQGVAGAAAEIVGVRVFGRHERFIQHADHGLKVAVDPHPQHPRPLAAIDRQHAMGRDVLEILAVVEVVAKGLDLLLFDLLFLQLAFLLQRLLGLLPGQLSLRRGAGRRRSARRRGGFHCFRWGRHSCLPGADRNVCPTGQRHERDGGR